MKGAAWRRRSLPRTVSGVRVPASRKKPTLPSCARRSLSTPTRQAHGDPDCPVRFGTHDGRVAHSAHLRKLHSVLIGTHDGRVRHSAHLRKFHSVRFGIHDGLVAHSAHLRNLHSVRFGIHDGLVAHSAHLRNLHSASRHLRLGGRDLTENIMKWFSLHPRGRVLWISQRNSASWRGLRHSAHDCSNSKGEDQRAHRQHLHCWRQTPPFWPLPACLLRHIWLCQLDSGLYAVAVWSFVFHGLWLGANAVMSPILEPHDRQIRDWAMLMSVSAMNSFLYTLLLRHSGFGERPTWARPRRVPRHPLSRMELHCHDRLGTTALP